MDRVFKVSPKRINVHIIITRLFCFSNCKGRNKTSSEIIKILHLMQISKVMTLLVVPAEDKSYNYG